jgi:hypothetical protein
MEKLLIMCMCVPTLAFALLGETKQQSLKRYGKPFSAAGNVLYYKASGYVIAEWFNPNGVCELINYMKLQGPLTKQAMTKLGAANLPSSIKEKDWIEQPSVDPNSNCWVTLDYLWYCEIGTAQFGGSKYQYPGCIFGTVRAYNLLSKEMGQTAQPQLIDIGFTRLELD